MKISFDKCIVHTPKMGVIETDFFPFQKKLFDSFENNQLSLVVGARKVGLTTALCYYAVMEGLSKSTKIVFYGDGRQNNRVLSNMKQILERIGFGKLITSHTQSHGIELSNGTTIRSIKNLNGYFGDKRRESESNKKNEILIVDNMAYIDDYKNYLETLSLIGTTPDLKIIFASCLKPYSLFNYLFVNENAFKKSHIHLEDSPNYDSERIEQMKLMLQPKEYQTEIASRMTVEEINYLTDKEKRKTIFWRFESINRMFCDKKEK